MNYMNRINFHSGYHPATARPYTADDSYVQVPASPLLQPYIRCYWGSVHEFNPHICGSYDGTLIVPDTCLDLIMIQNLENGHIRMLFVCLNDTYTINSWDKHEKKISVFAVRFHCWTMNLISRVPMTATLNQVYPPDEFFPGVQELGKRIFDTDSFQKRIRIAEEYIKRLVDFGPASQPFFDGMDYILNHKGVSTLKELSEHLCYSKRQTQRIFTKALGITPGYFMDLVRYQSVWQEMLAIHTAGRKINYMDIVAKYGYSDQSHFITDFKKYHSMTPREALNSL